MQRIKGFLGNLVKFAENIIGVFCISFFLVIILMMIFGTSQNPFWYLVGNLIIVTILRFTVKKPKLWKIINRICLVLLAFLVAVIILLSLRATNYTWALFWLLVVLIIMRFTIKNPETWKKIFAIWLPLAIFSLIFVGCLIGMLFAYPNQIGLSYWSIVLTLISLGIVVVFNRYVLKYAKTWKKYVLFGMFLYMTVSLSARFGEEKGFSIYNSAILSTTNVQKAAKIIDDLELKYFSRLEYEDDKKFYVIPANRRFDEYVLFIADNYADDKEVNIPIYSKYFPPYAKWKKHPRKIQKAFEKYYNKLVLRIKGISSSDIHFEGFDEDNKKLIINIDVLDGYDTQKIYKTVDKLFECYKDRKINMNIVPQEPDKLYHNYKATINKIFRKEKKYAKMIEISEEAKKKLPADFEGQERLSEYIECAKAMNDLDSKIQKESKNYKYYIERGDVFVSPKCPSRYGVHYHIENYQKAIELNPKSYDVYEKMGDTIDCTSVRISKNCRVEYTDKLINYFKALKYSKGNIRILQKIADAYYDLNNFDDAIVYYLKILEKKSNDEYILYRIASAYYRKQDYKNALKYYEKIDNKIFNEKIYFEKDDFYMVVDGYVHWGDNMPYDIYSCLFSCYEKSGEYGRAIDIARERLKINTEHEWENKFKQEIYNQIFDLDMKMKNHKQAKVDAKNCSRFLCKIMKKLP